jgi:maltose alpha-D-glucosyltransferase/alpha-amylase
VLSRIAGARKGVIFDGMLDDDTCSRLLALVAEAWDTPTARGSLRGQPIVEPMEVPPDRKWVRSAGDERNSVAFVSERYVLKVYRRLESGRQGFPRTPPLVGALEYQHSATARATLAIVQGWVTNQGTGWQFSIDELRRYYERAAARMGTDAPSFAAAPDNQPPPFFTAMESWYLANATTLGRRTAELHLALAASDGPAFAPGTLDAAALQRLAAGMKAHAGAVLTLLESRAGALTEAARQQATAVLAAGDRLIDRFDSIGRLDRGGSTIRIHGDYHLGQVLRTEEDFVIIDFEGEPRRSFDERRGKRSPLEDVAGMVRSFSYAAYAALFAFTVQAPGHLSGLEGWAETWQTWVSHAFLTAYRTTIGSSTIVPDDPCFTPLLDAFVLDKALSELDYELNNRPDWVSIPLTAIQKLG